MRRNSELDLPMYSVKDLAAMRLPGYPDTERAWLDRAKNGNWDFKEVVGRGRGGIKRLYLPPPEIVTLIEERQPTNDSMLSISDRLRKVLADLNRTAKNVAEEIDLPYRTLQNYLHGEREPNPEGLEKISRLGINLHWLLTGEGGVFVQESDSDAATPRFHPSLAEKIGAGLFEVYGSPGYGAMDEKTRSGIYGALYSAFCQIGASETAVPGIEEVKTMIEFAIKYGKAPAPLNHKGSGSHGDDGETSS